MHDEKAESGPAKSLPLSQRITKDAIAGFLVFLIALPLCLAIARASGYPPIGGIITAIVGGIIVSFISNSELTIKGPAAGLIVIVAGCVADFGGTFGKDAAADFSAYRMALAVGVIAAGFQILFGLFKAGKLGDFFPTAVVHGLLASIGVIIMIKSGLTMLGVTAKLPQENTELIKEYPHFITMYNLPVAIVGLISLAIMVLYPLLKIKALKAIPVQVVVLLVAIPLAIGIGLRQPSAQELASTKTTTAVAPPAPAPATSAGKPASEHAAPPADPIDPKHAITLQGKQWSLNPAKYLINVPSDFTKAFTFPDFQGAFSKPGTTAKWVIMFAIIASLESLLSAKAVDLLDPQKRKTDLNRDLFGCGVANLIASGIGGLPMISEIVRSRANVDNGAQSRFSNLFHGLFLLLFVSFLPFVVNMIPTAALAAMLVFTGFRLAHPREFIHMYKIGIEQFIVFVTTIVAIVCTDLLVGAIIGLVVELVVNMVNGLPIMSVFSSSPQVKEVGDHIVLTPQRAAVFSNWLALRGKLESLGIKQGKNVVLDLSQTRLVDHTVMEKLHEMQREFRLANLELTVTGLDDHSPFSTHPAAARKRPSHLQAA